MATSPSISALATLSFETASTTEGKARVQSLPFRLISLISCPSIAQPIR